MRYAISYPVQVTSYSGLLLHCWVKYAIVYPEQDGSNNGLAVHDSLNNCSAYAAA